MSHPTPNPDRVVVTLVDAELLLRADREIRALRKDLRALWTASRSALAEMRRAAAHHDGPNPDVADYLEGAVERAGRRLKA